MSCHCHHFHYGHRWSYNLLAADAKKSGRFLATNNHHCRDIYQKKSKTIIKNKIHNLYDEGSYLWKAACFTNNKWHKVTAWFLRRFYRDKSILYSLFFSLCLFSFNKWGTLCMTEKKDHMVGLLFLHSSKIALEVQHMSQAHGKWLHCAFYMCKQQSMRIIQPHCLQFICQAGFSNSFWPIVKVSTGWCLQFEWDWKAILGGRQDQKHEHVEKCGLISFEWWKLQMQVGTHHPL